MRSAIHARDGRRPPGLRRTEWPTQRLPTNLSSKLQQQSKAHTWNLVLSTTGRVSQPTVPPVDRIGRVLQPTGSASVSRHLCTRWCAICGAPDPSLCWCGASLVPTMHETAYEQLADFYYNPRDPLSKNTDPTDQRALQKALFDMANKARVTFNDPRRFGAMDLMSTAEGEDHPLLKKIGPEPFGNAFNETYLCAMLTGRKMPIKTALLDQKIIAGLGNIYVCEALFRAGISPLCRAADLSQARVAALVPVIRQVL